MTAKIRALARDVVRKQKEIDGLKAAIRVEMKALPRSIKQGKMARDLKTSDSSVSLYLAKIRPLPEDVFNRMQNWRAEA